MSQFDTKSIMPRFIIVALVIAVIGGVVLFRAAHIIRNDREYWSAVVVRDQPKPKNAPAVRGNILSCDGQLMAGSIPEYRIYMDFQVEYDSFAVKFHEKLDSVCMGLHDFFPEKSAADFREHLLNGYKQKSRSWPVVKKRIDYNTYIDLCQLPFFRMGPNRSGFYGLSHTARKKPFGTLANNTLGFTYAKNDSAYAGLELAYDSVLRGTPGRHQRQKVLGAYILKDIESARDGSDIVTTIDVNIQDIAESALLSKLKEMKAEGGTAMVMEVKTGDIKAIVNLQRAPDSTYFEGGSHALMGRMEPGSVFKTASFMVALDDGVVDTSYVIHTGDGSMPMRGRTMKDHNWQKGGYGDINIARSLEVSSNIGVSYVIDHFYYDHPEKFVEGLRRIGIAEDLKLPLRYCAPVIRMPQKDKYGHWTNWSKTALAWMSIGYETLVPPISTLTFYNGIANNGKMVKPRFVTRVEKDGQVLKEYPVEVLREQMAKPQTIATIQTMLRHVVSQGLGKQAACKTFPVSGKTGTAQVAVGGKYKNGKTKYLLSFCGYFPSNDPQYTCIVCIKNTGGLASGGGTSGIVFHNIAEGIMARNVVASINLAVDNDGKRLPEVKSGNMQAADYVLQDLSIKSTAAWQNPQPYSTPIWGNAVTNANEVAISQGNMKSPSMPDVSGLGAGDAVYLLESKGLKVTVEGRGKVKSQSLKAGTAIQKGARCHLKLA